jgi:hypothetical protein
MGLGSSSTAFFIQSKYIIVDAKLLEDCPGDVFDCFTKDTFDLG